MREIRPFISYAREDTAVAERLYDDIHKRGGIPWLDARCLLPGQEWEIAVRDAIRASSHFVAVISARSVNKRGFVQKELHQALEILGEFPPGATFVVPVRIDESVPGHDDLRRLHWLDLFPSYDRALPMLMKSLGLPARAVRSVTSLDTYRDNTQRDVVEQSIKMGGTMVEKAQRLGVTRHALLRLLRRYHIV